MKFLVVFLLLFSAAVFATHSIFQENKLMSYLKGKQQASSMLFHSFVR
jgi:hypothetical protein